MTTSAIDFGSKKIKFRLAYSQRKSLGITVTPEMEILVKAPVGAALDKIHEKLRKKAPWILKQLSYFLSFQPKTPARKYIGGESHLYLGRQYRLLVQRYKLRIENEQVKIKSGFLEVYTDNPSNVEKLVKNWYRRRAEQKLREIALPLIESFAKRHNIIIPPENFVLRQMPTRWGSCTAKGKIIVNPELIKAPAGCIEYVILHELCHLVHRNHTQRFFDLQTKEMHDWAKWKTRLEKLLA